MVICIYEYLYLEGIAAPPFTQLHPYNGVHQTSSISQRFCVASIGFINLVQVVVEGVEALT